MQIIYERPKSFANVENLRPSFCYFLVTVFVDFVVTCSGKSMCTPYEGVITRNQSYLAERFELGYAQLSLFYQEGFITSCEYQRIEKMLNNNKIYKAASALLDILKLFSSRDWKKILKIFKKTETGELLINCIKEKLGMHHK